MAFGEVLSRFVDGSPWCVMARGLLEAVFAPPKLDELFDAHAERQYEHKLLFSTMVEVMSQVVCRIRRSVNDAHGHLDQRGRMPVSPKALYDKLGGIETQTSRALVRHTAQQVGLVLEHLQAAPLSLLAGYDLRIIDGNHPASTHKRLKVLRDHPAAALPGVVVAVLDPQRRLIEDVLLSVDGHAQECTLWQPLLQEVRPRQLWLADRHYCTSDFLFGLSARAAFFLVRQHAGHLRWRAAGETQSRGRVASGAVYEQELILTHPQTGAELKVRRITLKLDKPTREGEREICLLSNLPAEEVSALVLAELYLQRWQLETAFHDLTVYLKCEPNTLGYPEAALFAFCVAVACYNLLAAMRGAVRVVHGPEEAEKVSNYRVADELSGTYRGMDIAVPQKEWDVFRLAGPEGLARLLKEIVGRMKVSYYHKYPSRPKRPRKKKQRAPRKHVSTHRLLNPALYEKQRRNT